MVIYTYYNNDDNNNDNNDNNNNNNNNNNSSLVLINFFIRQKRDCMIFLPRRTGHHFSGQVMHYFLTYS